MAIATALLGINDLGSCSGDPYFSLKKQILFKIICTLSKNEQKSNVGSLKNFKISAHGTWNPAILRLQGAVKLWSLNANLLFEEPHQLTKCA